MGRAEGPRGGGADAARGGARTGWRGCLNSRRTVSAEGRQRGARHRQTHVQLISCSYERPGFPNICAWTSRDDRRRARRASNFPGQGSPFRNAGLAGTEPGRHRARDGGIGTSVGYLSARSRTGARRLGASRTRPSQSSSGGRRNGAQRCRHGVASVRPTAFG
jgi:hypothetical protein